MSLTGGTAQCCAAVEQAVSARTGLAFPPARRAALEAAIRRRCAGDADGFLARVQADPQALQPLLTELTVGETYFFREPAQLEFVRDVIAPELLRRRGTLRMWSAGCATGEEPYSLAMLARAGGWGHRAHVLGTDLSRRRIEHARAGRFTGWSMRGGYDDLVAAHTHRAGGELVVSDALRQAVEFSVLNLAEDPYPPARDLILCRNVLIYLDAETVARVAQRLVDSLGQDGWLLLGASDPPLVDIVRCRVELTPGGLAYRREHARARPPLPPAPEVVPPPLPGPVPPRPARPPAPPSAAATPPVPGDPGGGADPAAVVLRVRALADGGRLAEAAEACAAGLDLHPGCAELWYLRSVILAEGGMHGEAAAAARRALYLERTLAVAHVALGLALQRLGDARGAARPLAAAEGLLAAMPGDSVVPSSMGELAGPLLGRVRARLALLARETG